MTAGKGLRVLHVYKTYLPEDFTGVPRVIQALAQGMSHAFGVESKILTLGPGPTRLETIDGNMVHIARRQLDVASTPMSLPALPLFKKLADEVDVVNYHFPWPFGDVLHFWGRPKAATVATYHSDIVRQRGLLKLYAPLRDRFLESVDRIVATSPNYLDSSAVLRKFAAKTTVIPIGMAGAPAVEPGLVAQWRARVGEGFFLFVGALRYYKGLHLLMEASRLTGLPIVVAGGGPNEEWVKQAGSGVTFVGPISETDKLALLILCGAFVFPSHLRSEAFGVALLEAARAGRAMISLEIGTGTSFINRTGETGLVVAPDASALASAMSRLAADPQLRLDMGAKARIRYEQELTADAMANRYDQLYRSLVSGRTER